MRPELVILDRDGVINFDSPDYILHEDDWRPIPGSLAAIARLKAVGVKVAIASNQSALGRGMIDEQRFAAIHAKMMAAVAAAGGSIDHVAYCPHGPDHGCDCRKPRPGLVLACLQAVGLQGAAHRACMIGDSVRDVGAARAAGVPAMLVRTGYGDAAHILREAQRLQPDIRAYHDLAAAVDALLEE
ncbi:MAG: D-glycero-beta-D-manno-heptose 1,7-bisphosphate 7-phosphatase [Zetaproteobacteria bacterium]|nr:MAG: D-glycero-beta-D-manno-heptose 1,7-bisphosphate 7-phosphatase [Zetaproteobacteria bacterium]